MGWEHWQGLFSWEIHCSSDAHPHLSRAGVSWDVCVHHEHQLPQNLSPALTGPLDVRLTCGYLADITNWPPHRRESLTQRFRYKTSSSAHCPVASCPPGGSVSPVACFHSPTSPTKLAPQLTKCRPPSPVGLHPKGPPILLRLPPKGSPLLCCPFQTCPSNERAPISPQPPLPETLHGSSALA